MRCSNMKSRRKILVLEDEALQQPPSVRIENKGSTPRGLAVLGQCILVRNFTTPFKRLSACLQRVFPIFRLSL